MSGSDERDDVYDDIVESGIELDNADVLEADKDPQQKMGNFTSPVTDESLDAAQEEKSKAMDAHSEGRLTEAVDHLTEAVLLNPVSAILYASRGSVYVKMKELNAATPIRDANAASEVRFVWNILLPSYRLDNGLPDSLKLFVPAYKVRFYYSFTCSENLYLVKEYLNGGCLDEDVARVYIAEVVLALEYLHSLRVVHRDLKPDNLLIAHDCHIKLTDFGLSKVGLINRTDDLSGPAAGRTSMLVDDEPELSTLDQQERMKKRSAVCTPDYLAPEILLGTGRGFTADWWSVGIILFELIVGIPPFNAEHPQIIFDNILNRKIPWPEVPDEMSPEARDIIFGLLTEDPHMRLGSRGASEVKQHVFFKNINWDTLARKKAAFVPASDNTLDTSYFMSRYTWNTSADNACPGSDFEDSSDADSLSGSSRCLSNRQEDVLHLQSSEENGDISMKQLNIRWTTKDSPTGFPLQTQEEKERERQPKKMASSSQAKRGEEVTRFFRIILQHAIVAKKLMIPRKFIRENGQQLLGCDAATLEVPTGDKWEVGLKTDRRGFVWFCSHGWEEFTEFYSLDIGHFLLFQYKGHSDNFSVVICDRSAVEIDYPTLSRAANVGRAVEIESEDDSLSVEILDDVDAAANKRDVGKGKAPMVDDGTQMKMQRRKLAGNVMSKKAATMDDGLENRFESGHSALQIEIKKGHLSYGHQSRIPFRFIERHPFMRDVEQMVLEIGDKVWKVRLALAYNKYVSFAAGWTKFAKDNSLNLGDVCVFKMVTMSPDVRMKVTIIRGV